MCISAEIKGGTAPYTLIYTVETEEEVQFQETVLYEEAGIYTHTLEPAKAGIYTVSGLLTDHTGTEVQHLYRFYAADRETETAEIWEQSVSQAILTGIWSQDLVAIARTQLGYCPGSTNFVTDDNGAVHHYTRYGDWYGQPYDPWSAMFVAFCLEYANIPATALPRNHICQDWKTDLEDMGVFKQVDDVPAVGDIIFFGEDGHCDHMGIVSAVDDNQISTLEGDRTGDVQEFHYESTDPGILGFISLAEVFRNQLSCRAVKLYEGDNTDLIPGDKMAVAIAVSGITEGANLSYNDGTNQSQLFYNTDLSEKAGYPCYVALVSTAVRIEDLENRDHYTLQEGSAPQIRFGDYNRDGIINAQEALDVVNAWLRKDEDLTDADILAMNINGDGRINTFDVLGIVEAFVNSTQYAVVNTAAEKLSEPQEEGRDL